MPELASLFTLHKIAQPSMDLRSNGRRTCLQRHTHFTPTIPWSTLYNLLNTFLIKVLAISIKPELVSLVQLRPCFSILILNKLQIELYVMQYDFHHNLAINP
jgi:hypothetical protein